LRQLAAEEAREIYAQITADASRMREERARIMAEMQSKIFAITQDVTLNRKKAWTTVSTTWMPTSDNKRNDSFGLVPVYWRLSGT
jgi:hypothetical protein